MPKVKIIGPELAIKTSGCDQEAVSLRSYCEARFPVGEPTSQQKSVTGENYTEFFQIGEYLTPASAREHAQEHFDRYCAGRKGKLYWRIAPEIGMNPRKVRYGYYMRLLISDKPVIGVSHV